MHYFVACLPNRIATLLYIVSMTQCTNHLPWDTETPSHIISHDEYYEKRGTTDKTKHKPSMLQPRIWHTRITTRSVLLAKGEDISRRTVSRRLVIHFGSKARKPAKKPRLTPALKAKRLGFAKKHAKWTI